MNEQNLSTFIRADVSWHAQYTTALIRDPAPLLCYDACRSVWSWIENSGEGLCLYSLRHNNGGCVSAGVWWTLSKTPFHSENSASSLGSQRVRGVFMERANGVWPPIVLWLHGTLLFETVRIGDQAAISKNSITRERTLGMLGQFSMSVRWIWLVSKGSGNLLLMNQPIAWATVPVAKGGTQLKLGHWVNSAAWLQVHQLLVLDPILCKHQQSQKEPSTRNVHPCIILGYALPQPCSFSRFNRLNVAPWYLCMS